MMKTKSIHSIETVTVCKDFTYADVLLLEDNLDGGYEVYPLHIVFHPFGELDFYKGNKATAAYDSMNFSDEVWNTVYEWISNNIPALED